MNAKQKDNYRRRMERQKIATERAYVDTFFYALRVQKAPVLKQVREHGPITALIYIDQITPDSLYKAYKKLYYNIAPPIAEVEYQRLLAVPEKKGMGFSIDWLADISEFLDQYLLDRVIRPMTALTMERMRAILTNGIATGESYDQMTKKLEDTETDRVRARLIARTETNRATNYATDLAKKNYPFVVKKEWLTARDMRTRGNPSPEGVDDKADHFHMNGQTVDDNEAFIDPRNQAKLLYPGDSTQGASAADICNCRCQLLTVPQRDANGRLIRK
jgi:hypothetical protein